MIPEIGSILLCLALGIAVLLSFYPLWGVARNDARLMSSSRPLAWLLFLCVTGAFLVLVNAFIVNDFSVTYVANNSNTQLPIWYRIAATWGAHEGSLLLWVLLMSGWTFAVAIGSYRMPLDIVARVLAVMGMVSVGFLLFIIFTSNPFSRTLPAFPIEGRDLNPLLQDPGLIFHPPLLYMGYVGFSVAFAFAIAALLSGRLDSSFTRFARPWTMAAWFFLTLGIMLGSAWAYYELGWGGWWFWDPVENASFMPWLVGTALIHSLSVTEQRATFKAWSLLLSIFAFSLCLLGTFLVRSGVLVSVHAFASDPSRGLFILAFMVLVVGGSLLVFALRGHKVRSRVNNALWSRESMLLGNNVILTAAMLVVLLGTLLPLVHKQIGLGTISIGEPFFNTMFIALMVPFALLLGIGPLVRWGRDRPAAIKKMLIIATIMTLVLSFVLPLLMEDRIEALTVVGLMMACWIAILAFAEMKVRISKKIKLTPSYWGMVLAHLGLAVTIVGIAFSQNYSVERDVKMKPGDSINIRAYTFTFNGVREADGPNYQGVIGSISVTEKGKVVSILMPEKRFYNVSRAVMTEAAIDGGFTRDLYAALGEEISKSTWSMRLYYKPFVRWIWSGGVLMAVGALFCMFDPRYRRRKLQRETAWIAKSF
ncbi:heme lyase CcmF/NrfE family subunit [Providencia rettgeri]|uniref:Heme lyase CcmF/NrfE family subunit n=4 Tax=Providencia TaxID=586 RepID=A0ABT9AQV5_9GAMM|nr:MULTISPECIES: heme lyase CcmF/NrfE family subunit [Providencia]MDK3008538.1 heme lyase CcmF/NrfE family subunit [Providencia rettgeri]MDO7832519.1 heme lyase CcmF/NrfE family subunit [Providencia sp. CRE-138-0026]MDO7856207.1 heme lyase CcmF/NrfE family subunit [Providencia sp. CRE-138-0111]MDR9615496.1 heme lyase CcmF/NrfE family subunit [Providencia rettgeri]